MKLLNILIVALTLIVAGSGVTLGYLIYQNYFGGANDSVVLSENNTIQNRCVDSDGDGYGLNCSGGPDCDDSDLERNVLCKVSVQFDLVPDRNSLSVGGQVKVKVIARNVPETPTVGIIQLRFDYDTNVLQYVRGENFNPAYLPIDLENTNPAGIDFTADSGQLTEGQEIVTLVFNARAAGRGDLRIDPTTRVEVIYDIEPSRADITVL